MAFDLDAAKKSAQATETTEVAEVTETQEAEVTETAEVAAEETEAVQEQVAEEQDIYKDLDLSKVKFGDKPVSEIVAEREALQKEKEAIQKEKETYAEKVKRIESDAWLNNLIEEYQNGGDVEKYLSAKVDWDKKDDINVLRVDFEKKNADLPADLLDIAFRKDLVKKYGIDPFDEDTDTESADYKYAQALTKRDATKARSEFKEEQSKYTVPKPKEAIAPQNHIEDFKKQVLENPDVRSIQENKLLQLDVKSDSGDSFNYELESSEPIVEMMWDESKFWKLFLTSEGKVDLKKAARVFAYANDPAKFESQVFEWGKKSGTETLVKQKKNIDGAAQKPAPGQKPNDKAGLAKEIFGKW